MIIYCVNDGAVMEAWAQDLGADRSNLITLMGDPSGAFTRSLDVLLTAPGPNGKGLHGRCKRFAMYLVDGVVKIFRIAEVRETAPRCIPRRAASAREGALGVSSAWPMRGRRKMIRRATTGRT